MRTALKYLAETKPPVVPSHTARGTEDQTIAPHYKNNSKYVNEGATDFSSLDSKEQDRQSSRVQDNAPEGVDLSHEGMVNRLMTMHRRYGKEQGDAYHAGGDFYHAGHALASQMAEKHGVQVHHATGVLAALSPGTDWDRNVTQAHHMMNHVHDYDHLDAPEAAKQYHASVATGNSDGIVRNSLDNYTKAFHIARGGHPDDFLGGHKVRSFANNLLDPNNTAGRSDVTMDRHAVSAAVGGTMSADRLNDLFYKGSSAKSNTSGTYAHFAHAYREAHKRLTASGENPGAQPSDFQAKIWGSWRGEAKDNGKKTPENRLLPHYASSDVEPDLIDPEREPFPGEPDPDLLPEENEEYWEERRGERNPHEGALHVAEFAPAADTYTAGYFDGVRLGAQSSFRNHLTGEQLSAYDNGLRAGLALHYAHVPLNAATGAVVPPQAPRASGAPLTPSVGAWRTGRARDWAAEMIFEGALDSDGSDGGTNAPDAPDYSAINPGQAASGNNPYQVPGNADDWRTPGPGGEAPPTEAWQYNHGPDAPNPAQEGTPNFGHAADPDAYPSQDAQDLPDEQLLAPGPAVNSTMGISPWFTNMAAHVAIAPAAKLDHFEGQGLINEGEGSLASNLEHLSLEHTHYVEEDPSLAEDPWWI